MIALLSTHSLAILRPTSRARLHDLEATGGSPGPELPRSPPRLGMIVLMVVVLLSGSFLAADESDGAARDSSSDSSATISGLIEKANLLINDTPSKALDLATQALELAEAVGDPADRAESLRVIGIAQLYLGQYQEARESTQACLELCEEHDLWPKILNPLNALGVIHRYLSDYQSSQQYFERILVLLEREDRPSLRALTYNNIGSNYFFMGDLEKALEFYHQALRIREGLGEPSPIAQSLNNVAVIYDELEQHDTALEHYQRSLELFESAGDDRGIVDPLNNIGTIYYTRGEYDTAETYHLRALEIRRRIKDRAGEAVSLNNLGNISLGREDTDGALSLYQQALAIKEELGDKAGMTGTLRDIGDLLRELKHYDEALEYLQRSLALAEEIEARNDIRRAHLDLTNIYSEVGAFDKALRHHRRFFELDNEIRGEEAAQAVAEQQTRYETEKKQKEITALKTEARLQGRIQSFFVVTTILVLALTGLVYSRYRLKSRANCLLISKNEQIEHQRAQLESLNTVLEVKNKEYYISSIMDALTETYNKAYVLDVIQKTFSLAQRHEQPLAVVFFDLDKFKNVNDTLGHLMGDRVLQEISAEIRNQIRTEDTLGRYGGEEFLLILPNTDVEGACLVAEKVRKAVGNRSIQVDQTVLRVTLSSGVAEVRAHCPESAQALIRQADAALYTAKRTGRDRTVVYSAAAHL